MIPLLWIFVLSRGVIGDMCTEMRDISHLSCRARNLTYIPAIDAKTITLDFCFNYLPCLNQSIFPELPHLHVLDLTRCQIHHIADDTFHNVRNISTLILTGNPIKHLGNGAFNFLDQLQKLVLVDTGLSTIEGRYMNSFSKLQELNVGTNHLSSISIPATASSMDFRILDFHTNNISIITADQTDVLRCMGNNITIILTRNPILYIEPGTFRNMNLKVLDLLGAFASINASIDSLRGLTGLRVKKLVIGSNYYPSSDSSLKVKMYDYGFFNELCMIDFQEILLQTLNTGQRPMFHCMSNATKITLQDVNMGVIERVQFHRVKEINLIRCKLYSLPDLQLSHQHTLERLTITGNEYPVVFLLGFEDLPLLRYMDLSNNKIMTQSCCTSLFRGTPHLQHLNMSNNPKITIYFDAFQSLGNLEVLDFHKTKLNFRTTALDMTPLTRLQYLDISYTYIDLKTLTILGLKSVRVLNMSGNTVQGESLQHLLVNLTLLETLDISYCGIENLLWNSFSNSYKLRHLTMSGNKLTNLDFLANPSFAALTLLDIGKNHISSININILQNLLRNLSALDLSYNPFDCSCSQTDSILWLVEHENILVHRQNVLCVTPSASEDTVVLNFDIPHCTHTWWTKLSVAIFVVVLILALSALAYRFQFYLRYGCVLLRGYNLPRQQECHYDAFVIYSSEDGVWVQRLVENLENGVPPIQLCLHHRDFEAGRSIASNIIEEGIMGSRKVIVVVSRHFIDSGWCRFEFEVAQSCLLLDGNPNIIIVILEDVEEEKTKKVFGLHRYLKQNTYLEWKDNPVSNVRFWARLRKAVISKTHR